MPDTYLLAKSKPEPVRLLAEFAGREAVPPGRRKQKAQLSARARRSRGKAFDCTGPQ